MLEAKWRKPTIVVAVLLIAALAFLAYSSLFGYRYVSVESGYEFASNEALPGELLQAMASSQSFVLVLEGFEESPANAYNIVGLTTFNLVLNGNGKAVVTLARALDAKGGLLYCNTNDGDTKTNREMPAAECEAFLASNTSPVVYFHSFNAGLDRPRVVVSSGRIDFYPKELYDPNVQSYIALSVMYGNTDEVIGKSNDLLERVGASGSALPKPDSSS